MKRLNVQDQITRNKIKSVLLMGLVFLSIVFLGYLIGMIYNPVYAYSFTIIAALISMVFSFISYYYSDKIVLAAVNAKPANEREHKRLLNIVEEMAIAAGIPKPRVYVMESDEINAFATGRNPENGVICVTTGILKLLNREELSGVIAHEMSHIKNFDIRFATLVSVMVGIVVIVSDIFTRSLWYSSGSRNNEKKGGGLLIIIGIIFAILAPIFVKLVQLAISRKREYLADDSGAFISRYPEGLASALEKIKLHNTGKMKVNAAIAPLFFSNPLSAKKVSTLFSTHPDIDERIERLRRM